MFTIAPSVLIVKPADHLERPAPIAIVAEPADDFGPADDSPLWDEWAAESSAMDAVCSGHWAF